MAVDCKERISFAGMRRSFIVLWIVLLLLQCTGAAALDGPVKASVKGQLIRAEGLSEEGIAAANQLLERLEIRMNVWPEGEKASLLMDGRDMWQLERWEKEAQTWVAFSGINCYVTNEGQKNALTLLAGGDEMTIYQPEMVLYASLAEELFAVMGDQVPVNKMDTTEITNARASASYDLYTFTAEEMNLLWPQMLEKVWNSIFPNGGDEELYAKAAEAVFTSDVRIRRLYDHSKADMGLQLTGNGTVLGSERKISLLYGYTAGKGGSFTLSLRPVQGKDTAKITAALKETIREEKKTYTFSLDFSNTLAGEKSTFSLSGKWTREGERGSGETTFTGNDGITWVLSPDVTVAEEKVQGTMEVAAKKKNKMLCAFLLEGHIASAGAQPDRTYENIVSLQGMTDEQARAALAEEEMVLMRAMKYLMDGLNEKERWLLTHEMRTENWLNGPAVPVMTETEDDLLLEEDWE